MFIDEVKLELKAGNGGHGVVRWLHEKSKEWSGPSGGNGGNGGDVFAVAIRDTGALARYRNTKEFSAGRGEDGLRNSMHGSNGKELILEFPIGSIIKNLRTKEIFQLLEEGQKVLLLKGGKGGFGNEHFKSSTNVSPEESTLGKRGEEAKFEIELELFADAGFIGLPNAGKSSLLNELTNSQAKVGDYPFTTLDPNLGALYGFIIADIPGVIEGASEGKGLGHKFLRHIKRTKVLFHLVSLENKGLLKVYDVIRDELEKYDKVLAEKPEVVILTKTDLVSKDELKKAIAKLKTRNKKVLSVSIIDDVAMKKLSDEMVKILRKVK